MSNKIPGTEYAPQGNSTTINPNAQRGSSTTVNPNARRGSATAVNPNARHISSTVNTNGTAVNPNANRGSTQDLHLGGEIPIGTVLGERYRIISEMPTNGKEAKLYIAVDINTEEEFCIKSYVESEHVRSSVRDSLIGIQHRNIAKLHSWGYWSGMIYEVWTLYKGQNLHQAISQGIFPETQVTPYIQQLNDALFVVHNAGLVHQDIKPSNIMVMEDGSVALIDFGISASGDSEGRTHFTQIGNTTDYSSPEVLFTKFCWTASDYYSLGITIYEMLVGSTPYADYDESMTMRKLEDIRKTYIPRIEKFSTEMRDLLTGLLQYDKDKRWGYEAVQAWLRNDYNQHIIIPEPPEPVVGRNVGENVVYKFAGTEFAIPSQMPELVTHMAHKWREGVNLMDKEGRLVLLCNRLEKVAGAEDLWTVCNETMLTRDVNLHYFLKLYKLYPALSVFAWRGYVAENAQKLGDAILNIMWEKKIKEAVFTHTAKSSKKNSFMQSPEEQAYAGLHEVCLKHIISQYLSFTKNTTLSAIISDYEEKAATCVKQNASADLWYYKIGYALSGATRLHLGGRYYEDQAALVAYVNETIENCRKKENNDEFISFCNLIYSSEVDPGFFAWAESIGVGDEVAKLERALKGR